MSSTTYLLIAEEAEKLKKLGVKAESFDYPNKSYYSIASFEPKGAYPNEMGTEEVLEILQANNIRFKGFGPFVDEER